MKTLNDLEISHEAKKEILNFLINWAMYWNEGNDALMPPLMMCLKQTGLTKEEFENEVNEIKESNSLLGYLNTLKRYGHRPRTSEEIILHFEANGILSRRAVVKQIERAKKWKEIKEIKIKIGKQNILLYEVA